MLYKIYINDDENLRIKIIEDEKNFINEYKIFALNKTTALLQDV